MSTHLCKQSFSVKTTTTAPAAATSQIGILNIDDIMKELNPAPGHLTQIRCGITLFFLDLADKFGMISN